jgi:hypothetical protein
VGTEGVQEVILFTLLLVSSLGERPAKPAVNVRAIDAEVLIVTAAQPIHDVQFEDLYENTDYMLSHDPVGNSVRVQMLTERRSWLRVTTDVPKTNGLQRVHWVKVESPKR